jgi:CelD/BcsL family acetyltransferase involved in cellulose biosynthesis
MKAKTLIAIATLISASVSSAAEFATANKSGGQIRLTNAKCGETSLVAYTFEPEGYVTYGCWFLSNDMVHVTWSNGDVRVYPASLFMAIGGK